MYSHLYIYYMYRLSTLQPITTPTLARNIGERTRLNFVHTFMNVIKIDWLFELLQACVRTNNGAELINNAILAAGREHF